MISCSDAFKEAVKDSHQSVAVVEILDTDGSVLDTLVIESGSVEVARTAAIRRRTRVRAVGTQMVPVDYEVTQQGIRFFGADGDEFGGVGDVFGARTYTALAGALLPYGTEFRVRRGVRFPDGTEELVSLGVFVLDDLDITDDANGVVVDLVGLDRSRKVSDARWTELYVIAAGTNYADAIEDLIADRYPAATFDFMTTSRTTPLLVLGESTSNDPWADARRMAADIGAELFFDADGTCVLRPEPSPTAPEVWSIVEGPGGSPMTRIRRRLSVAKTYNGVIVTGENPGNGAPVRAEAWDMNPTSPTYRMGPFGSKPRFYTSEYIRTEAQAQDAANALLLGNLGLDESVSATIAPMPALEASDVVEVRRARMNLGAAFVVESFSVPLGPTEAMTVGLRRLRDLVTDEEEGGGE